MDLICNNLKFFVKSHIKIFSASFFLIMISSTQLFAQEELGPQLCTDEKNLNAVSVGINTIVESSRNASFKKIEDDVAELFKDKDIMDLINVSSIKGRPRQCPMLSSNQEDIFTKFKLVTQTINSGRCGEKNRQVIDNFKLELDRVNDLSNRAILSLNPLPAGSSSSTANNDPQSLVAQMQTQRQFIMTKAYQMVTVMNQILVDPECLFNVKERGMIPVLADALSGVSQISSTIPNPMSLSVGVGGVALGSALRLISGLLSSDFNWSKEQDRNEFIKLTCTFYDFRRELFQSKIMQIPGEYNEDDLQRIKEKLSRVNEKLKGVQELKKITLAEMADSQSKALKSSLGSESLDFLVKIPQLKETLSLEFNTQNKLKQLKELVLAQNKLKLGVAGIDYGPEASFLKDDFLLTLDKLSPQNFSLLKDIGKEKFEMEIKGPLLFYFDDAQERLVRLQESTKRDWSNKLHDKASLPNGDFQRSISSRSDRIEEQLIDIRKKLEEKKIDLEKSLQYKTFVTDDDGTSKVFEVFEDYKKLQRKIFGKEGYSFISFLLKKGSLEHFEFQTSLDSFKKTYPHRENFAEDDSRRIKACRDLRQLKLMWKMSNVAFEEAYDFLYSQQDLFFHNFPVFRVALGVPIGESYERGFNKHFSSSILAKKVMEGNALRSDFDRKNYNDKTLGQKMLLSDGDLKEILSINEQLKCSESDFLSL